ncbi:MAG: RraA family protein [Alphaproteobacteria bacterium]|nr:RraA family protein [Alphaproteobacteria bacterium]
MPMLRRKADFRVLSAAELSAWRDVQPAVAGDAMNRSQVMAAAIKPIRTGLRLCAQARTVETMVGDNGTVHAALALARPGEVLVVDGRGHVDTAIWGEIMTRCAIARGLAGVVIDGATRDAAALRELGFAAFVRGTVPRGPHKGFGGTIDGPVSVGGVAVRPGDLVLGDDDGVTVVPLERLDQVLAEVRKIEARESQMTAAVAQGKSTAEINGIALPEVS